MKGVVAKGTQRDVVVWAQALEQGGGCPLGLSNGVFILHGARAVNEQLDGHGASRPGGRRGQGCVKEDLLACINEGALLGLGHILEEHLQVSV